MDYQFDFEDVSLAVNDRIVGHGFSGTAHVSDGAIEHIVLNADGGKYLTIYPQAAQNTGDVLLSMSLFHCLVASLIGCEAWNSARYEAFKPNDANAEHRMLQSELI